MCCRRMILGQPSHFALVKSGLGHSQTPSEDSHAKRQHTESFDVQTSMQNIEYHLMMSESAAKTKDDEEEEDEEGSDMDMEP
jgi:hypothetical protein